MRVLVVGASLAGVRAAEQLRAAGYADAITLIGDESHLPYSRPPLSKEALTGDVPLPAGVGLRMRASLGGVEWRLGVAASALDLERRTVTCADGGEHRYDGLVVATGLRPRRLVARADADAIARRTAEDALLHRAALAPARRVVVIGAGFLGCEIASAARCRGCAVTVVDPLAAPMIRGVGRSVGERLRALHEKHGVAYRLGTSVASASRDGDVCVLVLDDGSHLLADVVVEAVGCIPNVEWLADAPLDLSDGVLCDGALRVGRLPDVVAVGDVARFPNPRFDAVARRVEHWSMAGDTAAHAARTLRAHLAGTDAPESDFAPLPSFWSDQFGVRIQAIGLPALGDRVELLYGKLDDARAGGSGFVTAHLRADQVVGVIGVGVTGGLVARFRSLVGATPNDAGS